MKIRRFKSIIIPSVFTVLISNLTEAMTFTPEFYTESTLKLILVKKEINLHEL